MHEKPSLPPAFQRLFLAGTASNLADGISASAGPLLAYSLTHDARTLGLVAAAGALPWLLVTLPVGAWLDRASKTAVMRVMNVLRLIVCAALTVLVATNTLGVTLLAGASFLLGAAAVVLDMASQNVVPELVENELLERANGRLYAAETVAASAVGTPIGAALFSFSQAVPFAVNAAALAVVTCLLVGIGNDTVHHRQPAPQPMLLAVQEGVVWLARQRLLRILAVLLGVANLCSAMTMAVFVKFAHVDLGIEGAMFGLLLAVMALGAVIGGALSAPAARSLGAMRTAAGAYIALVVLAPLPALWANTWVVAISGAGSSAAITAWGAVTVSLRQRLVPRELFGRVNASYRFIGSGATALGAVIGGIVARRNGLRSPYLVAGLLLTLAALSGLRAALRRSGKHIYPQET